MIEECRKRPGSVDDVVFDVVGKRPKTPAKSVEDECDYEYYFKFSDDDFYSTTNELPIKEETIEAVMNLLEKELNDVRNASIKMKETCGVTFSDESSTVMASFDLCGLFNISYLNDSFPFQSVFYTSSTPQPLPLPPPTLPFTQLAKSQLSCSSVNNNNQQHEFEVCYSNVDLVNRIGVTEQEEEQQVSGSDETNGYEEYVVSTGTADEINGFDDQETTDLNDDQWMDLLTLDGFSFDLLV
ncbi:hypothetical protein FRX31_021762 [Thalictrum thalictroides]|uniref:Uncharacterized protein n=1 Tax=Thalictrum thalictroides TaxID=46969 RepID=A0A7J6VV26_THATH|nr:hypothetical protein FRX31_021762 [Thalictrum thalictroides]